MGSTVIRPHTAAGEHPWPLARSAQLRRFHAFSGVWAAAWSARPGRSRL